MGRLLDARVTLIAPDGRVVGDSAESLEGVAAMENHATRPEVIDAKARGVGRARRHSDTLKIDMLCRRAVGSAGGVRAPPMR
jgi:two-component system phosphate regulon sensor histidine kinase PhoR